MSKQSFVDRVAQSWPPKDWHEVTVVLAVSGGADSVALLRAISALKTGGPGSLVVAHYNHSVRGKSSDEDELFVRSLSGSLGLAYVTERAAAFALQAAAGDGFEAVARQARYDFLARTAHQFGARYVATAHTADDQVETVLHRILRGTGIAGLAGIPRARSLAAGVTLIRPLLPFRRGELRQFLNELGQPWREDVTNWRWDKTRNRIRGELLPQLARDYNPEATEAILRLSELASDVQLLIDDQVAKLLAACVLRATPAEVVIDAAVLAQQRPYLVCEFFIALWRRQNWPRQRMGRDNWHRLAELALTASRADETLPGAVLVRRRENMLELSRSERD